MNNDDTDPDVANVMSKIRCLFSKQPNWFKW